MRVEAGKIMLTVNCLVVFTVTFPVVIHSQLYSGDNCILTATGGQGVCKTLGDCPAALENLQKNQQYPQTCGFQGSEPVICCPTAPPRVTGEISKEKCREYSRYTKVKVRQPILIIGAPDIERDECGHKVVKLIVGGEPAGEREFPHQATIGFEETTGNIIWACGGSIISERFILTAAHCLSLRTLPAKYVRMGITNLKDYGSHNQQIKIARRIAHPKYTSSSQYYDIGLVKLETNAVMNSFSRPACLYRDQEIKANKSIATGWGTTAYAGATSDDLLKVTLDFFSQESCNKSYRNQIKRKLKNGIVPDTQICAGSLDGEEKDTCQGDSGGPLQIYHTSDDVYCMYDIVGITSFGKACGGTAGVYTRVSYFIKWIEDIVWPQ